MVRGPFYDKNGIKRGAWSSEEDDKLRAYVEKYGHWNWRELPKFAGLSRCGKSCRLRWINYLRPDVKRGNYSAEEESLIIELHQEHGNKWSLIAAQLPGRTDNEVKNHWHTHLKKRSISSDQSNNSTKSQTSQDLSRESSQYCDETSHDSEEEATINQAESSTTSTTTPSNFAPSPQILESSQLSPMDTNVSTNSSASSFSLIHHERKPRIDCRGERDDNHLSSSFEASCDQEYFYFTGLDFWTKPFMEDKINIPGQTEYDQTYFVEDGGILSPYPYSLYDDGMDYFSQL